MTRDEIKALARVLDRQRRELPREQWPSLWEDVQRLRAVEWSGDGEICQDCRRARTYGHQCGCPVRLVLKYLGVAAEGARVGQQMGTSGAVGAC